MKSEKESRPIPECLLEELRNYAGQLELKSGPIFLTYSGESISRTTITNLMKRLSVPAQVEEEKISPRCLKKMYQGTLAEILESVDQITAKTYAELLEREQQTAGWEQV